MKVTDTLIEHLEKFIHRAGIESYSEMARRTNTSYMLWSRILQRTSDNLSPEAEDALCKLLNVPLDELARIVNGDSAMSDRQRKTIEHKAMALWRWVQYDKGRSDTIKALGFKGELPARVVK